MTDEAFEKYQSVWTAVHNLVDKMLSGEAGAEDIRDKLTDEFRFWKRSGHDISATTPQPEQPNDFHPDWDAMAVMVEEQQRMAKRIEELEAQPEQELVIDCPRCGHCCPQRKPLTDEDWQAIADTTGQIIWSTLKQAIEAKLKEKNT